MKKTCKLLSIIGARPQFVKMAPMVRALEALDMEHQVLHTGQHYDYEMSKLFFEELGLTSPHHHLEVGSGSHGEQTAEIIRRTEKVLLQEKPDWVLVYGDTNSTLGGALAAAKLHLPIAHIEAGLRSFNRQMPEEINRVLTDHLSTLLCCPTEQAVSNLKAEGFSNILYDGKLVPFPETLAPLPEAGPARWRPMVVNMGDVMYDAYLLCQEIAARRSNILEKLALSPQGYFLATVHREENTNGSQRLGRILEAFSRLGQHLPVIWPLHPRTRKVLEATGLGRKLNESLVKLIAPVGYFDMLILAKGAAAILTDSGGVQKEAFFARVPCLTLRQETEWVETVSTGYNVLVGTDPEAIVSQALNSRRPQAAAEPYGRGDAAGRILAWLRYLSE
jgi:UDP-GlcNAc3NAcA epimerase